QQQSRRPLVIDATIDVCSGIAGAATALRDLFKAEEEHSSAIDLVVVSDREVCSERAALPILLATSAVWKAMSDAGQFRVPLIVETAQAIDTHHIALLLAVGATAVSPFLAMRFAEDHEAVGASRYRRAVDAGLRKVLARMGISTLASYRN